MRVALLAVGLVACVVDNPTFSEVAYLCAVTDGGNCVGVAGHDLASPRDLAMPDLVSSCGHAVGDDCCFSPPNLLVCDPGMECDSRRRCYAPDLLPSPPDLHSLCGDGWCGPNETCMTCEDDCGPCGADAGPR